MSAGSSPVGVTISVRLTFAALVLFWGTLFTTVTIASLPYSPISMALDVEVGVRSLVPEGWGFFTREPRSLDVYLSQQVGNDWRPVDRLPIANPRNLFGIDRRPRAIPVELAVLLDQVNASQWTETTNHSVVASEAPVVAVVNPMKHPLFCGPLRVMSREPVPWAWFADGADVEMPSWVVTLDVQCHAA